jgi:IS6 family transposase
MNRNPSPFKWRHSAPDVILLCVKWYCRYQLSYRDVEEMMRERGLDVDHSTVFRWVQRYAPEINKRIRQHPKMSGTSYRVDETYISMNMIRKGQVKRLAGSDARGQAKFVESLFGLAA